MLVRGERPSTTNLAPGMYRFHVTACNNDGVWNDVGATLAFSVAPAWYQTTGSCSFASSPLSLLWWRLPVTGAPDCERHQRSFRRAIGRTHTLGARTSRQFLQTIQGSKLVADDALDHRGDPVRMRRAIEKVPAMDLGIGRLGVAAEASADRSLHG